MSRHLSARVRACGAGLRGFVCCGVRAGTPGRGAWRDHACSRARVSALARRLLSLAGGPRGVCVQPSAGCIWELGVGGDCGVRFPLTPRWGPVRLSFRPLPDRRIPPPPNDDLSVSCRPEGGRSAVRLGSWCRQAGDVQGWGRQGPRGAPVPVWGCRGKRGRVHAWRCPCLCVRVSLSVCESLQQMPPPPQTGHLTPQLQPLIVPLLSSGAGPWGGGEDEGVVGCKEEKVGWEGAGRGKMAPGRFWGGGGAAAGVGRGRGNGVLGGFQVSGVEGWEARVVMGSDGG